MKTAQKRPSAELIRAAEVVFLAMAYEATIRPTIEAIQNKLLKFWKIEVDPQHVEKRGIQAGTIITDWKRLYLASDQNFKLLLLDYDEEIKKSGFNVPKDFCPLLMAENDTSKAEKLLIEASHYITGLTIEQATRNLTNYKKIVELTLKLCAPFVSSKEILQKI